jgi:small ligand-binding sensory domain FIST
MDDLRFASALSTQPDTSAAVQEVAKAVHLGLAGRPCDLVTLFVSHHHGPALDAVARELREALSARTLVGCTGETIIGGAREIESGPALAVWAAHLPDTELRPFTLRAGRGAGEEIVYSGGPEVSDPERASLLLLGDPYTFPMADYLVRLAGEHPHLAAVGGMASGGQGPGQNLLFLNDDVVAEGALGLVIEGRAEVVSIVSQGCRPVGQPWVITSSMGHTIQKLGGRPAVEALMRTLEGLSEDERKLLGRQPFMGLAVDARKSSFERGDFLVRGILHVDTKQGTILVGDDSVRAGMTVQFLVRDAGSADEDLQFLMASKRTASEGRAPHEVGALLFSCNGRGMRMFGTPNHDIACVQGAFGAELPAAGFFALGEIGPVGGQNFLHGFTASLALFRDRDAS